MKEDILEQLVEDWFVSREGFFVKHNVKYRPAENHKNYDKKKDSSRSDIDIIAVNCRATRRVDRVWVVTCKSWQSGFKLKDWLVILEGKADYNEKSLNFTPREKWKYFRELVSEKWISSFVDKIYNETNQRDFTYCIATTSMIGSDEDRELIERSELIRKRFKKYNSNMEFKIIDLRSIIDDYFIRIKDNKATTLESTDVGRFLQLIKAAKMNIG